MKKTISLLSVILFLSCQNDSTNKDVNSNSKDIPSEGFELLSSQQTGITFNNSLEDNPLSSENVLSYDHYYNGAGVGIGDFNNDGLEDIFFAGNEVPNEIFINKGNFQFEKLPNTSGINQNKNWASGVSIVDINNDGFVDIYVSQQGPRKKQERGNLFFINNGDLTFTERAAQMNLNDDNYSTQSAFFDYDKDGDLDCYVMNESRFVGAILGDNFKAASGKLFRNEGNMKFTEVTSEAGVQKYGYGLGLAISDINADGYPDIYVANDYAIPDFMFINQGDGTFKESIKEYTQQISYFGMGCDIADINNDGLIDITVVDMAAEDHFRDKTLMASMDVESFKSFFYDKGYQFQYMFNSLQINNGNNTFSNVAAMAGILKSDWSWAAVSTDFNLDGHKDIYVTNGFRRYPRDNDFRNLLKKTSQENGGKVPEDKRIELYNKMPQIKLQNKLYINKGNITFDDNPAYFKHPKSETYSYGMAVADFDNDGDPDIVINNIDQEATVLKNKAVENTSNNWLKIKLNKNKDILSLGSKVYIKHDSTTQFQEYYFTRGYESTMQSCLFFGLGKTDNVDEIKIIWPDNKVQILKNQKANQILKINYKPLSEYKSNEGKKPEYKRIPNSDNKLNFIHIENDFDDFEKEVLLPQKQSAFGPALAKGDINNDGLHDLYIGGAKNQESQLFIQTQNGKFELHSSQPWKAHKTSEDVDALFMDIDKNGHQDLIVLSGGGGDFVNELSLLKNRVYLNQGNGVFEINNSILPQENTSSYKIITGNIDADTDKELFILGAAKPGQYPITEISKIYDYVDNKYVDITNEICPTIASNNTLLRDAIFMDINNDKIDDLITVGEWDKIKLYINENGKLNLNTNHKFGDKNGWWKTIKHADLDNDGDIDFIVGNVGKNFKQKATKETPLYIYSNDFDNNGTLDCVLAKPYNGKIVPARGKECSTEQMPFVSEKFKTYADFASASVIDIYGEDKLESGIALKADDFYSYVIWNNDGNFKMEKLPSLAQSFPINAIEFIDYDGDKFLDIIIAGNDYNTEYETPRLDAGYGLILKNINGKSFEPLSCIESGIYSPGDVKTSELINSDNGQMLILANNNGPLDIYKLK